MDILRRFLLKISYLSFLISLILFLFFGHLFYKYVTKDNMDYFVAQQTENVVELAANIEEKTEELVIDLEKKTKDLVIAAKNAQAQAIQKREERQAKQVTPLASVSSISTSESIPEYSSDTFLSTSNGADLVYYNQGNEPWGSIIYGGQDTLAKYGCGPTVLSMVLSTFLKEDITPKDTAEWAFENGYYASQSGSYHTIIPDGATAFGLDVTSLDRPSSQVILEELKQGKLIVVLMNTGAFTNQGHFLILRDYTADGQLLVADSQNLEHSNIPWDINLILNEAKYYASAGGPFWSIGPSETNS